MGIEYMYMGTTRVYGIKCACDIGAQSDGTKSKSIPCFALASSHPLAPASDKQS